MAGLRSNRSWTLLLTGGTVSNVGDYVFDTTMVLWIGTVIAKGQSWAPAAVSGVLLSAAIPAIFVGPAAGVFVDRWNRRRIMLVGDACRTVLILALLPLAWPSLTGHIGRSAELTLIYAVLLAASCFSQFFNPAKFAVLFGMVDEADRARAGGLAMSTGAVAAIIGPPIAAPLLFVFGVQWALIINALSFVCSFVTIALVKLPAAAPGPAAAPDPAAVPDAASAPDPAAVPDPAAESVTHSFFGEFRAGVRFFATSRVLIAIAIGVVIATLGTGVINSMNVFFVTDNLHVAVKWYGTMGAAEGIGAVLGGAATGMVAARIAPRRIFWGALVLTGILCVVYSRMTLLPPALVLLFLTGAVVGTLNGALTPLVLGATPQEMLGRVVSVINPLQQVATVSSVAIAGLLASTVLRQLHASFAGMTFGPYDTLFSIAGLLFIAGGLAAIPLLRPAPDPAPPGQPGLVILVEE
jgi:MFS family permease